MADDAANEKSLEMRVAELEDKLSKVHITEDEMKAYQKVAGLLAAGGGGGASGQAVADCISECGVVRPIVRNCTIMNCTIMNCTIIHCIIRQPIIRACTQECFECGGGLPGGGVIGGQFGQLGG